MKRLLFCALAVCLLAAPQAHAADIEARDICLCRQVIARTLCKSPSEIDFIDRFQDSPNYSFTVFYAKKEERFICNVSGNEVRIKGNAWITLMRTVSVTVDPDTECVDLDYYVPECPRGPVRCCAPKSKADIQQQKDADFWSRPIPDLLQDELQTGIAREANATANQTAPGN
ncbi:hypothetical protein [Paucidesulfovibrio longus]|uniref:hypothetical protein n=1 Tax=Paucidesulfovibrio longus TaxID=889 RepID=UPI0003B75209|nr:hypothetical protein [Paucidesulfovibrio longus]